MWRVRGVLRDYDWGPVDGLVPWCEPTGAPQAELWFGVHPSAPAPLVGDDGCDTGSTLADVLPAQQRVLLVKLLAAARPLSIQVHPAARRAEELFARGLLPDDQAKIEALTALTPFCMHVGWRTADEVRAIWSAAGVPEPMVALVPDRGTAVRAALAAPTSVLADVVPRLGAAVRGCGIDPGAADAIERIAAQFPADPGVLICTLMEYAELAPGAAVGVEPGLIHSYIEGVGVEVMTSSDNVLRLGLTTKPVLPDEVLAALDPDVVPALPPGPEFPFDVRLSDGGLSVMPHGYRVVLCLDGEVDVACGPHRRTAPRGQAVVLAQQDPAAEVLVRGRAAIVTSR